jgi:transcriptional regulator with XRE-family HTH domain
MLTLNTEADILAAVASALKQHRMSQGLRQVDLAERSGVAIATLRRFERTGHIGFYGLAKLLVTLGLADAFVSAFKRVPERPASAKDFTARVRVRAPRHSSSA